MLQLSAMAMSRILQEDKSAAGASSTADVDQRDDQLGTLSLAPASSLRPLQGHPQVGLPDLIYARGCLLL